MNFLSKRSRLRMSWYMIIMLPLAGMYGIYHGVDAVSVTCFSGAITVGMAYIFGETYRPSGTIQANRMKIE